MRTTLDIDNKLLEQAVILTGEKNKGKAVNKVLTEWIRRIRIEELKALAGKIEIDDNLKELEELELKEMAKLQW